MQTLADWPRAESVTPADYAPLATFSCGASSLWETEIDDIFTGLSADREPPVRIVEDSSTGELIGAGAYVARSPSTYMPIPVDKDAFYILALGLTKDYRRRRLPDGSRIGDFLLEDLLTQMQEERHNEMPAVWAIVARENAPCIRLMDTHGFGHVPTSHGPYDMWYRQRGLDPDWWREP